MKKQHSGQFCVLIFIAKSQLPQLFTLFYAVHKVHAMAMHVIWSICVGMAAFGVKWARACYEKWQQYEYFICFNHRMYRSSWRVGFDGFCVWIFCSVNILSMNQSDGIKTAQVFCYFYVSLWFKCDHSSQRMWRTHSNEWQVKICCFNTLLVLWHTIPSTIRRVTSTFDKWSPQKYMQFDGTAKHARTFRILSISHQIPYKSHRQLTDRHFSAFHFFLVAIFSTI